MKFSSNCPFKHLPTVHHHSYLKWAENLRLLSPSPPPPRLIVRNGWTHCTKCLINVIVTSSFIFGGCHEGTTDGEPSILFFSAIKHF